MLSKIKKHNNVRTNEEVQTMVERNQILKMLRAQVDVNGHIVGATVGTGLTAKLTAQGGADILLALSAGKMRQMGRGSLASYFSYGNNNDIVMRIGTQDILPLIKDKPVIFGLFASDPTISLYEYIKKIKENGFAGITNFPTLSLIDGKFREALEENGDTYDLEAEAIHLAHFMNLFTIAFVTNSAETEKMLAAGADVICAHLGVTKGGFMGVKKTVSLDQARRLCKDIFTVCKAKRPAVIRMVYAGPANTPIDMQYLYQNTDCQGYIGGSTFDRIPVEQAIVASTRAFKSYDGNLDPDDLHMKIINGNWRSDDYVDFIKQYISEHYMSHIEIGNLALVIHVSPSYLSTKFKKEMGCSFTEYLVRFRINKARELLETKNINCREVAESVGYEDYAQFSRIFKKYVKESPKVYQEKVNKQREKKIKNNSKQ